MNEATETALVTLRAHAEAIRSKTPSAQGVAFDRNEWVKWFDGEYFERDVHALDAIQHLPDSITRQHIFGLAQDAKTAGYPVSHLKKVWVAAYAWGGGPGATGYRARINARLSIFDRRFERALEQTADGLSQNQLTDAHHAIDQVIGAGEGFFSKFLYFVSSAGLCDPLPLIYDEQVKRSLRALLGTDRWAIPLEATMEDSRADIYLFYVETMHLWAKELGCAPDQLELFLFEKRGSLTATS